LRKHGMLICFYILFLIIFANTSVGLQAADEIAQKFEKRSHTFQNTTLPYRLFIPENYNPAQTYPMMLCLHGSGERGTNNDDTHISMHGLAISWADSVNQSQRSCFVVAPQCPPEHKWVYADWHKGSYDMDTVAVGAEMLTIVDLLDSLIIVPV